MPKETDKACLYKSINALFALAAASLAYTYPESQSQATKQPAALLPKHRQLQKQSKLDSHSKRKKKTHRDRTAKHSKRAARPKGAKFKFPR